MPRAKKVKVQKHGGLKKVKVEKPDGLGLNGHATTQDLFKLCPKEIWSMILLSLEDSKDIFNVFKAYPEMEGLVQHKRQIWLFDRVIPNIAEWVDEKDLLSCREVSKQWSSAVDNFLENHPSLRAYQHEHQLTGQVWGLENYSKCFHGPKYSHHEYQFSRPYFQTSYVFDKPETFERFTLSMKNNNPKGKNPIVGRSVKLYPNDVRDNYADEMQITAFWDSAHRFLREYGEHIWFISIWGCKKQNARNFFQMLQHTLSLLPNLKSLEVNSGPSWISRRNFSSLRPEAFPILPSLETLKLDFRFRTLSDTLIRLYGSQTRRLVLLPRWDWDWKMEYVSLFPNLTEIEIRSTVRGRGKSWMERMNELLLFIDAPQLHWLHIEVQEYCWLKTEEICGWLRRFPRLKQFRLAGFRCSERQMPVRPVESITSIESLSIHDSLVNPKFLLCFPSLQCLEVRMRCRHYNNFGRHPNNEIRFFQEHIQNGNLANVWILLPKLQTLILVNDCKDIRDRFSRSKFECYLRGLVSSEGWEDESMVEEDNGDDDDN